MNRTNNDNNRSNRVPENDPSKAMDSKKEVENSNDEKTDQDFPGYPHYPAKEDIMDQRTDSHRVDVDVENIPANKNTTGVSQRYLAGQDRNRTENAMEPQPGLGNDDLDIRRGTGSDVNSDDLAVLNSTNDEIGVPQNVSTVELNSDLDIPGAELDDENENIGEEDEENNYYSLGGDRHEAQEEDPYSGPDREGM
ncbi:MAG: hypothetical protein ACTHOF_11875 [Flavisolibacter sp.]|jgi:hypothetical protein